MLLVWSCIEVVITGRTRNALALRGTRVRIPPTPLESRNLCFGFFYCFSTAILFKMNFFPCHTHTNTEQKSSQNCCFHFKLHIDTVIVNDIGNFVFGLAGISVYGCCKRRKQKFVMGFTIVVGNGQNARLC